MNRIELKKYLAQYEYLQTEYEYTKMAFEEYNKRFLEEYYTPTELEDYTLKKQSESPSQVVVDEEVVAESNTSQIPCNIKMLYKKLTLLTHPDKVKGKETYFRDLQRAYACGDVISIIKMAETLGYPIEIEVCEVRPAFETVITKLTQEIDNLKQTLAWHWGQASEAEKESYKQRMKS